uniref:C-type lectin domain-containing protein n=1 Tax=Maylandia zebra TaxID=106582 RepID=A0A3P9BQF2_9CICH
AMIKSRHGDVVVSTVTFLFLISVFLCAKAPTFCFNIFKGDPCSKCEEGWEHHGGKCYYFSTNKSSWTKSRDECRAKGGDLAFLERRVRELMKEGEDKFWIGLTDSAVEGRWLWVDGSLLDESLKFWAGKEPNNVTEGDPDGEDCVRMGEEFENKDLKCWFDQSCSKPQRSICEKAGVTAT